MKANRSAKRLPCTAMRSIRDEVRPRKDRRGVDLISEVLPFGRPCDGEANTVGNAIDHAKSYSWTKVATAILVAASRMFLL